MRKFTWNRPGPTEKYGLEFLLHRIGELLKELEEKGGLTEQQSKFLEEAKTSLFYTDSSTFQNRIHAAVCWGIQLGTIVAALDAAILADGVAKTGRKHRNGSQKGNATKQAQATQEAAEITNRLTALTRAGLPIGHAVKTLAAEMGVSESTIQRARRRKNVKRGV